MIITRTPLRISFCGGGSDLPAYYENNDYGCVISTTIDKYIYVICKKSFYDKDLKLRYIDNIENVKSAKDIKNDILREALENEKIDGIEIVTISDIPNGTGLGSSSAFTVGLIKALKKYKNEKIYDKNILAENAWKIEKGIGNKSIGKQDQWAASVGGLNYYRFNKDGSVNVEPINLSNYQLEKFQRNLFMIYVGGEHISYEILKKQTENYKNKNNVNEQKEICKLVFKLKDKLENCDFDAIGYLLNKNWELKKKLADGISNKRLDKIYEQAIECGATGGKLLGAGGGGFFLFYVPEKNHKKFQEFVNVYNKFDFRFEKTGSEVVYQD